MPNQSETSVTLINVLKVEPARQEQLLGILREGAQNIMSQQAGYISSKIYKSKDGQSVVVVAEWQSLKDIEGVRTNAKNGEYLKRIQELAQAAPGVYDIFFNSRS